MNPKRFLRAFVKRPVNYITAIASLCISFSGFIILNAYLSGELAYDSFHRKEGKTLYRVVNLNANSQKGAFAQNAPHLVHELNKVPEITAATRVFRYWRDPMITDGQRAFYESKVLFVDSNFYQVFGYDLVFGERDEVLSTPGSALVNDKIVNKYWGDENPIGKLFEINQRAEVQVTGIIEDNELPSHLDFDILVDMETVTKVAFPRILQARGFQAFYTYIEADNALSQTELESKIRSYIEDGTINYGANLKLQKVDQIHLTSDVDGEISSNTNMVKIRITTFLLFLILAIGFINFSNFLIHELNSITIDNRIKFVLGATGSRFLLEFNIKVLYLFIVAFILTTAILIAARTGLGSVILLPEPIITSQQFWITSGLVCLATVLLATIIPYLTTIKKIQTAVRSTGTGKRTSFNKGLLVFQLLISFILLSSTILVNRQIQYINKSDLGFTKTDVLVVPLRDQVMNSKYRVWKTELRQEPNVKAVSRLLNLPGGQFGGSYFSSNSFNDSSLCEVMRVTPDFNEVLKIDFLSGREFRHSVAEEDRNIIINMSAMQSFGFSAPEDAIGKPIQTRSDSIDYKIIGVTSDFKYSSLYETVQPLIITPYQSPGGFALVEVKDVTQAVDELQNIWNTYGAGLPLIYSLLEQDLSSNYETVDTWGNIGILGSLAAILISIFGIFSISSVTFLDKFRELAIRKVLGASTASVINLFVKEFFVMLLIAFVISVPVVVYFGIEWLNSFAYRTSIAPLIFLQALSTITFVVILTLVFYSVKTVNIKPVEVLKME